METNKNLNEFKELMKRYSTITELEIREVMTEYFIREPQENFGKRVMKPLTGFGSLTNCSLCKAVSYWEGRLENDDFSNKYACNQCVWKSDKTEFHCLDNITYSNISRSKHVIGLLEALKLRASYMQQYLKSHNL